MYSQVSFEFRDSPLLYFIIYPEAEKTGRTVKAPRSFFFISVLETTAPTPPSLHQRQPSLKDPLNPKIGFSCMDTAGDINCLLLVFPYKTCL